MRRGLRHAFLFLFAAGLAACAESPFDPEEIRIPGERIPIMLLEQKLKPDVERPAIQLPRPQVNPAWPQSGGYPNHAMHHLAIGDAPQEIWSSDIGSGSSDQRRLITPPVVAGGRVYVADAAGRISAFSVEDGDRLWRTDLTPDDEDDVTLSGGIAYAYGHLFVSTGFAQVVALNAETGEPAWRRALPSPMRSAPTVSNGRLFVTTVDNQFFAIDVRSGDTLWSHKGFEESAGILGGASPAVDGDVVIVPYTSGEVFAMLANTGRILWSYSLASSRRGDAISSIADIRGDPVIDRDQVFAVSHSGRIVALGVKSGEPLWEKEIGGIQTPWIAGDYIYLLTTNSEIVCLSREKGGVVWVLELPQYMDPEERADPIVWNGPVLASDRLLIAGSHGTVLAVSPYRGKVVGRMTLDDGATVTPVIAQGVIYFLTTDADLVAFR
ncbi:MAG: PQQ-binding-like beta-propeller repeat protein [Alphaproteobacteria bacterium]|nr:PQQ-binding-like beta-propeller repeat protein [Alphaproteobacteria bacterium]